MDIEILFIKISLSTRYKLGFETDFFNLSNNSFDYNGSQFLKSMQYLTVDSELVDEKNQNFKKNNIPVTNILNNEAKNDHLLGSNIKLTPRDLLYIFVDIEEEFKITIPESYIIEGKFNTFNNILQIIKDEITE
ncbi:peptide maturation system acyl carrier-related protein [Ruminiclostridium josui]|uniref:peptide maturation system acyl carrier-related protein n=1 Tax=Ruminiclostridium josui TaxID=1499 RepID=UPI000465DCF7|nr:peptide maturation system acyl carrier-related protein [Ruminiclostridium josui]